MHPVLQHLIKSLLIPIKDVESGGDLLLREGATSFVHVGDCSFVNQFILLPSERQGRACRLVWLPPLVSGISADKLIVTIPASDLFVWPTADKLRAAVLP